MTHQLRCRICGRMPDAAGDRVGVDALEYQCSRCFMAGADSLTGNRPSQPADQVRQGVSLTVEEQLARYLIAEYKQTRDSGKRADLVARMEILADANRPAGIVINQALTGRVSLTLGPRSGRPQKWADKRARDRAARRAYRERQRQARS